MKTLQFATFDSVGVPMEVIERNIGIWEEGEQVKVTKKDYITITEDSGRVIDRVIVYYDSNIQK